MGDIDFLTNKTPDRSLDTLESDVWARVDARQEANRISRLVLSCQALVLAAALVSSLIAGSYLARSQVLQAGERSSFANGMDRAPSTLLLGRPT